MVVERPIRLYAERVTAVLGPNNNRKSLRFARLGAWNYCKSFRNGRWRVVDYRKSLRFAHRGVDAGRKCIHPTTLGWVISMEDWALISSLCRNDGLSRRAIARRLGVDWAMAPIAVSVGLDPARRPVLAGPANRVHRWPATAPGSWTGR